MARPGVDWRPIDPTARAEAGEPRPDLLTAAARRLAEREGVSPDMISWRASAPIARPHSTLVPLVAEIGGGRSVAAWHKVIYVPHPGGAADPDWTRQEREGIERTRTAGDVLDHRYGSGPRPLRLPVVLAHDPATLTLVTTDVRGRPLGSLLPRRPWVWRGWRRRFVALGEAVAALETLLVETPPTLAETGAERRIYGILDRAKESGLPRTLAGPVEARLNELWDRLPAEDRGTAYAHGDLSGSNALIGGDGVVGLIDLAWRPRLRGFDLATYSVRLDLEAPRISRLSRAAIRALAAGYGPGALGEPGFLLERSQRLLRLLHEGALDGVRRRDALLRELAGLDPGPQELDGAASR